MLDRRTPPPTFPVIVPQIPDLHTVQGQDGKPAIHVLRQGDQRVLALEFYWPIPAAAAHLAGTTLHLVARMWQEGTTTRTASQIQTELARYGAFIETGASDEHLHLAIYTLDSFLPALLPLVADLLQNQAYPAERLELLKAQSLQALKVNRQKPAYLAGQAFRARLFGQGHLWGHPTQDDDIQNVSAEDLAAFYTTHIKDTQPLVFLSGQFDDALSLQVQATLPINTIGGISSLPVPAPAYKPGTMERVPKPGSTQATLRLGRIVPPRSHPDYFALRLAVEVYGGYFGSRLMKNVREEKGLTYGISARLSMLAHTGYLVIGADVNLDNYPLALQEIAAEMGKLTQNPIPKEELDTVRNYMLGNFASGLGTAFSTAEKHKAILLNQLPGDYYEKFLHAIRNLSEADIRAAAAKYLVPDALFTIVAGGA